MWKQRALTLKGKITIINSLALSQIMYVSNILYVPADVIKEVNQLIFSFLWPKKAHVKKSTIIGLYEEGGLKMPDFEYKVQAGKIMWIKRLLMNEKLRVLAESFGLPLPLPTMVKLNFDMQYLPNYPSCFYREVFNCWYNLRSSNCNSSNDVMKQIIWFNKNLLVESRPIYIEKLYNKSVKYVNDLLDENGNFLTINALNHLYNVNIRIMQYNSLLSSIPKEWKRLLRQAKKIDNIEENIVVKLNMITKSIFEIETRDVYWELIGRVCQRPSAAAKWEEIYDLIHFDWENIFCIPFHVARESSLQSFQYKIVDFEYGSSVV